MTSPLPKPVVFVGTALTDLKAFPDTARRQAGYQINRVQAGRDPDDWKPMPAIGAGCAGNPGSCDGWRFPGDLCGEVCGRRFRSALLSEEDAEDRAGRYRLAARRYRAVAKEQDR